MMAEDPHSLDDEIAALDRGYGVAGWTDGDTAIDPHGLPNYHEMTVARDQIADQILREATALCHVAKENGLVLTVNRTGDARKGMGSALVSVEIRVARKHVVS